MLGMISALPGKKELFQETKEYFQREKPGVSRLYTDLRSEENPKPP
jgi:hypothetical protein